MPSTQSHVRNRVVTYPPPRRWLPQGPERHSVIFGGRLGITVALTGLSGRGKLMALDATTWERVKAVLGASWCWRHDGRGGGYVVSERKQATAHAGGDVMVLARFVAGAGKGDLVTYRDGDGLNLMRGNLMVLDRAGFAGRVFGRIEGCQGSLYTEAGEAA